MDVIRRLLAFPDGPDRAKGRAMLENLGKRYNLLLVVGEVTATQYRTARTALHKRGKSVHIRRIGREEWSMGAIDTRIQAMLMNNQESPEAERPSLRGTYIPLAEGSSLVCNLDDVLDSYPGEVSLLSLITRSIVAKSLVNDEFTVAGVIVDEWCFNSHDDGRQFAWWLDHLPNDVMKFVVRKNGSVEVV
jgi:hypothetical protein